MPYRIDLYAVFIFLGMVQAVFLLFFFLSKENRKSKANIFHGLMLISIGACLLEIFLMYTGYIVHCFYLVDFSEAFVFLIGPSFYLMVISLTRGEPKKLHYLHFAFPVIYLLLQIPFLMLPEDAKYNAWVGAYHPEMAFRDYDAPYDSPLFFLTEKHTDLTIISLLLYCTLATIEVVKAFRSKRESFWKPVHPVLRTLRDGVIRLTSCGVLIVVVKLIYRHDLGDHILGAYIAVIIYVISFSVIKNSGFFRQAPLTEQLKYKSSSLTSDQQQVSLQKLKQLMEDEKPFLKPDFSLPELADQLKTTIHTLSQVINDGLGKTFFEMTAEYRVNEAKQLLKDQPNIKVEEIAEQVGYNSKSSFNTAFKKLTGMTPSEWRNA
ncbi:MAG TPA: helix-turn-helix domain-containing protein [Cyclobacteriaceae bacterium]